MPGDISSLSQKSKPHLLILPPWFDLEFTGLFAQMFHQFAEDAALNTKYRSGLIFGDFRWGQKSREWVIKEELPYYFLGQKKWTLPKVGILWKHWLHNYHTLFLEYRKRYGMPDLIHAHSILGLIAAGYIGNRHRIPFIYTEHMSALISGQIPDRLLNRAMTSVSQAEILTAVSPLLRQSMEQLYRRDVKYIPNYVDCQYFVAVHKAERSPDFISIGSPAYTKGMDRLIDAFAVVRKEIPEARLTLVDDIKGLHELKKQVARLNLNKSVRFTGAVKRKDIRALLRESAVLVSASREESFGLTMVEALSCGIPVVATQTAGSELIVTSECGKIVSQNNVRELADSMIYVYQHQRQYPPEKLHNSIKMRFGREQVLAHWESVYDSVLNRNLSDS